jgi:putative spermidine/putrescine transport system ATP-binding protein
MSDRLAVFNHGQIEQIGSPAEIYEYPTTPFVAAFVGVSNLVGGQAAQALTGSPETFSIRPEKIHLGEPDVPLMPDMVSAEGRIREVVYLGLYTRYTVELDSGNDLTVVEQNLRTTSMEALAARGRRVRLSWERRHNRPLAANGR